MTSRLVNSMNNNLEIFRDKTLLDRNHLCNKLKIQKARNNPESLELFKLKD